MARLTARRTYGPLRSAVVPSSSHSPASKAGAVTTAPSTVSFRIVSSTGFSSGSSAEPLDGTSRPLYGLGVTYGPSVAPGNRASRERYECGWRTGRQAESCQQTGLDEAHRRMPATQGE